MKLQVLRARRRLVAAAFASPLSGLAPVAASTPREGRTLFAGPANYRKLLSSLAPGDRLELAPGEYLNGLPLHGVRGSAARPIVIAGPVGPQRAAFLGRAGAHTVSLVDSEHVVVRNLLLDGRGARVDAVRAEGHARWTHHVTLEGLTIVNHGASQQNSGISTKCPAWGWVVRGNTIVGAGTGMYFGDSDGSDPFFDSLIEGNWIADPIGYGIQIKHQRGRPDPPPAPDPGQTEIRRNLIVKRRPAAAPELARPNLLVGHLPLSGAGAGDRYLVHGNVLVDNPSEALFQGEGNLVLYNNLLFNPHGDGVRIQPHNDRPRNVVVFNNTVVAAGLGIGFVGGEPGFARSLERNLVYGRPPLHSEIDGDNLAEEYEAAAGAFVRLDADPQRLDLTPRGGMPRPRLPFDAAALGLPGAEADLNGRPRGLAAYGACSDSAGATCP